MSIKFSVEGTRGISHTHIAQLAYPEEECSACGVVWQRIREALSEFPHVYPLEQELRTANTYLTDYGKREQLHHLTQVRERAQSLVYRLKEE